MAPIQTALCKGYCAWPAHRIGTTRTKAKITKLAPGLALHAPVDRGRGTKAALEDVKDHTAVVVVLGFMDTDGAKGLAGVESRTMIGEEATLFHDCRVSELTLRQVRNQGEADLAPFGLRLDVFRFDGSFLSLAIDLPESACEGLRRRHLMRLDLGLDLEKPLEVFARLNIRHGPNTEAILRELPLHATPADAGGGRAVFVEFDLAYSKLNERRVEKMWLDLIFEGPEMNQITIRDLTLARIPRAEL